MNGVTFFCKNHNNETVLYKTVLYKVCEESHYFYSLHPQHRGGLLSHSFLQKCVQTQTDAEGMGFMDSRGAKVFAEFVTTTRVNEGNGIHGSEVDC